MSTEHAIEIPRLSLKFEVHLVDHCNLNCYGCGHFAPISKAKYADIIQFECDMQRMAVLFKDKVYRINLLGGEPLLHPEINKLMEISRRYFAVEDIVLISNGVNLAKMRKQFWLSCKVNNVRIEITRYPININYERLLSEASTAEVKLSFFGSTEKSNRTFVHLPLDLSGSQNSTCNFYTCYMANDCTIVRDGRLFPCPVVAFIDKFNEKFSRNLLIDHKDYVNLYEDLTSETIFDFLCRPIPFCRYCDVNSRTTNHPWKKSQGRIEEWLS